MIDAAGLRVMRAIADEGSFTLAALSLGYSQPAISQMVRRLEQRTGTVLVERVGRNVRLGTQVRAMLAQRVFKRCGRGVRIFHDVEFSFGYNLSVGDGVTMHRNVLIADRGEVMIGNEASISNYANIYSHSHAVEDIHDITLGRTVIGDRARITYHAVVLSGVTVEADALVASMGVASKPIPAGVIAAGIPARPIGQKKTRAPGS